jgi:two-component system nitrate/nitrite response regulator NarL
MNLPSIPTDGEIEPAGRQVRVLIVQDHPMLASEIARVLNGEPDLAVVGVSKTGGEAMMATVQHQPDVVLMDFRLPDISGPSAAAMILAERPAAAIVFHSADDSEEALLDAIDAGATAYLTKSANADQIVDAVHRAARGEVLIPVDLFVMAMARRRDMATAGIAHEKLLAEFTPRELEILQLLAIGLDTNHMAHRLGIAPHTIEWHVRHVIEKLHVHSKLQAVIAAVQLGLIELTGLQ